MDFYILNTDAKSNGGRSPHDAWLSLGVAITSGPPNYREKLDGPAVGDLVLAYANGIGVVAVGLVRGAQSEEKRGASRALPNEEVEYHRPVDWLWDLRDHPIGLQEFRELGVSPTPSTVRKVVTERDGVLRLIARLGEWGTSDADLCARRASLLMELDVVPQEVVPATTPPSSRIAQTKVYERSPAVRALVLRRADKKCELCRQPAPFADKNDDPFLEVHHVQPLAEDGFDTIDNAAALCPNCHRELHYGKEREAKRRVLEEIVARANADMAPAQAR